MSDSQPIPECEECGEETEKVVAGSFLIKYNGDGFYQTDYNNKDSQ